MILVRLFIYPVIYDLVFQLVTPFKYRVCSVLPITLIF